MDSASRRAQRLLDQLLGLRRKLLSRVNDGLPALAALDLTIPQVMVIFRLVELGPRTITELCGVSGRSQGATSHLVTQLEKGGWVTRGSDPADRRKTLVSPTAQAKRAIQRVHGMRVRAIRGALARVPTPLIDDLDRALGRVLAALEDAS